MIRLITLPRQSQLSSKITNPSLKSRSPSLEIKLGQRRRRFTITQQNKNIDLNLSHKNTTIDSYKTSSFDQAQQPKQKIELDSIEDKMRKLGIKIKPPSSKHNQERAHTSYIFNGFGQCLEPSEVGRKCTTKREIIKLKHPKAKCYSPIEKLLRLIESSSQPQSRSIASK